MALSYVAKYACSIYQLAVPQRTIDEFPTHWQVDPDPKHIDAVDTYRMPTTEHDMNASTFTARVIASTGVDVAAALSGAAGAISRPLHGGGDADPSAANA